MSLFNEYDEQARGQPATFWETGLGLFLRWVAFLPTTAVLAGIVEVLVFTLILWLFRASIASLAATALIVIILLGGTGGMFVIPFVFFGYYSLIVLGNRYICPKPRIGAVIYGTLYGLFCLNNLIAIFVNASSLGLLITMLIARVVFVVIAYAALRSVYSDSS